VATVASEFMTTEEMLDLPQDGMQRWLIEGKLRERPMTVRNRHHSETQVNVSYFLKHWVLQQPEPRGKVYAGEAGVILARNPDVTVGVDVLYITNVISAQQSDRTSLIEGIPTLVVEISSPSDVEEAVNEKIDQYLRHGVSLVWIVDPYFETVVVHERGQPPRMVNVNDALSADPYLPGFSVRVVDIFRS
jgi:Uma2 family endonuclease